MKKLQFKNAYQEELFNNNIGFAYKQAIEWNKRCEIELEELQSYALESLCLASVKYEEEKCDKFLNYAALVIDTNIKRQIKTRNTKKRMNDKKNIHLEDDTSNIRHGSSNNIEYNDLLIAIDQTLEELPQVQQEAIKRYLIDRNTLNELAEKYEVSMRTIHKWIIKGRELLQQELYKKN